MISFVDIAYAGDLDTHVTGLLSKINTVIINPFIIICFAIATLVFLWGLAEFLMQQNNEEARVTGRSHMLWGIVGLCVMFSVFGILRFITNTFGITGPDKQQIDIPQQ